MATRATTISQKCKKGEKINKDMKKIMFDDRYGLTKAVLEGRKTMTRRIVKEMAGREYKKLPQIQEDCNDGSFLVFKDADDLEPIIFYPKYKVGEVVAVAQSYLSIHNEMMDDSFVEGYEDAIYDPFRWAIVDDKPGWSNKMFVSAYLMPHQIRITNVRIERLKDISDEDCIREGIEEDSPYYWVPVNKSLPNWRKIEEGVSDMYPNDRDGKVYPHFWDSPRKAFAALIDKVSGRGTWADNPWVYVYEFELVK